jgi:hypothetical protein
MSGESTDTGTPEGQDQAATVITSTTEVQSSDEVLVHGPVPLAEPKGRIKLPIVLRFALQMVSGTFAFTVMASAAGALSYLTHLLPPLGVPSLVMAGLQAVEQLVFWTDVLCMVVFVAVEAITFIRATIRMLRSGG